MNFTTLNPDVGYRSDWLWLPRSRIDNLRGIQNALAFDREHESPLHAWTLTSSHLIVPREFIPVEKYADLPFPVVDVTPEDFQRVEYNTRTDLRGVHQRLGFSALIEETNGVLSLPPGKGKTVVALHAARAVGYPTAVIVGTSDLAVQWRERILDHLDLRREDIGWVQGDTWDWEKPITVMMDRTLLSRIEEIPEEMRRFFGTAIYDEAHHLGAVQLNQLASLFYGHRWGLSATPKRSDGLEMLYQYHVGPVVYATGEHDIVPEVFFIRTPTRLSEQDERACSIRGELHYAKLLSWLATNEARNDVILSTLADALEEGRKILVLSDRLEQLAILHSIVEGQYPGVSGLVTGEVKGEMRYHNLNNYQVVFGISALAKEALDRQELDTILMLTPLSDEYKFRQILGRIQRTFAGKKQPVAVVFEDHMIPMCAKMCQKLRAHLASFEYPFRTQRD